MGTFTSEAAAALTAAEAVCGPFELEEISNRRGSAVWKASGPQGVVSIKLGTGDAAEVTAREAAVLDQLPEYTVTVGRFADGVWYVTPWQAGPSTWDVFRSVRKASGGRPKPSPLRSVCAVPWQICTKPVGCTGTSSPSTASTPSRASVSSTSRGPGRSAPRRGRRSTAR
ncbi:hypothetical protein BX285_3634 [Streptomyces sp. 1114.5]|nr:hypothetical protein BX285_3634 [Streptomyces sp. 1114.5]